MKVGDDLVLSWCVPAKELEKPYAFFFLKRHPCGLDKPECRLAQMVSDTVKILPNSTDETTDNIYRTIFSPSQLDLLQNNCSSNNGIQQTNFTLLVKSITVSQGFTYKFVADYPAIKVGEENDTKVEVHGKLSACSCSSE